MEAAPKERLWQSLETLFKERLESLFKRILRALKKQQLVLDEVQLHLLWVDNMFKPFRQSRCYLGVIFNPKLPLAFS